MYIYDILFLDPKLLEFYFWLQRFSAIESSKNKIPHTIHCIIFH